MDHTRTRTRTHTLTLTRACKQTGTHLLLPPLLLNVRQVVGQLAELRPDPRLRWVCSRYSVERPLKHWLRQPRHRRGAVWARGLELLDGQASSSLAGKPEVRVLCISNQPVRTKSTVSFKFGSSIRPPTIARCRRKSNADDNTEA